MTWVWWCNDLGSRCNGVGLLVMAPMGLNGFNKGLNWSSNGSDSDFFLMGLTVGCCVFFFFFGVDDRSWVSGGGGVRCV